MRTSRRFSGANVIRTVPVVPPRSECSADQARKAQKRSICSWMRLRRIDLEEGDRFMRATVMYGAGDVRVANVPDASLVEPTDAIVRVTRACICGSDLWPYRSMEPSETGQSMGHEAIGVVEAVGRAVEKV